MTLTLLLDLDNTLLGNDMDTFLPAYLQGLAGCFAPYTQPEQMLKALMSATRRMIENNNPLQTLKSVFDSHFYPSLGLEITEIQHVLDHFYTHEYTHLRSLTQLRPEAQEVVRFALQQNYQIVVATNPLFPATAINQRVAWAGLPPEEIPFAHITTYETAHFAKPNLTYYAEILARLGWPDGPVLMVGDDFERDITPANTLGISTYWIHENGKPNPTGEQPPTASGPLSTLLPWLEQTDLAGSLPTYDSPHAIIASLRATLSVLTDRLQTLPEPQWQTILNDADWSLTEIVCHMRDTEEKINLQRLRQILREDNPFIPGVDTDAWDENNIYQAENGLTAFQTFCRTRLEILDLLSHLSPGNWSRPARHSIFGPTTFREITQFIAEHDRLHIRQILGLIKG